MNYTDIEIIECNKKQSINVGDITSNNALFTNKLGRNITLNEGDTINVEYSFINEKGCGSDTIEIEGKDLGTDTKRFYYTADTQEGITRSIDILDTDGSILYPVMPTLERRQIINNPLLYVDKMLRDDEINIQQHYYRTTNCEQYCFLPRRFISTDDLLNSKTASTIWKEPHSQPFNYTTNGGTTTNPIDNGACGVVMSNPNCIFGDDYKQMPWKTTKDNSYEAYIPKTSAEKYTLLCRDKTYVDMTYDNNKYLTDYQALSRNSPALRKYDIFTTLNTIKVDKGFNSPQNIASKITQQLQSNEEPVKYYVADPGSNKTIRRVISETTDTSTYKAINCACINTFDYSRYTGFLDNTDTTVTDKVKWSVLYEQSFQYIGCKRPHLTILGRKIAEALYNQIESPLKPDQAYENKHTFIREPDIALGDNELTASITTNWEYTDDNLKLLRDLFIEQGKYPELFTRMPQYYKTYIDAGGDTQNRDLNNLAFLHTNQRTTTKNTALGSPQTILGDDGYNNNNIDKLTPTDLYSLPFFFYCDRNNLTTYDTGQSTDFLCYGFATYSAKSATNNKRYIVIHPELSGGTREWINDLDPWIKNTQLLGWDCHYSAYSSQFIMLWNGHLQYDYGGELDGVNGIASSFNTNGGERAFTSGGSTTAWRLNPAQLSTSAMLSKIYVGASNSALSFLTNGHFSWSYLHEPERKGQINKVLRKWCWSPDYTPYDVDSEWVYGGITFDPIYYWTNKPVTEEKVEKQSLLNPRLTEFTLTDSMSGVFFNLGDAYTEELWGESLLGILGFSYSQYNPKIVDSKNNILSRITNKNIYGVDKWITTNSDVVATEVINYIMNRWNATQYTSQIPTSKWLPTNASYEAEETWSYEIIAGAIQLTPNIVEGTQSIEAEGEEYPKKMLQSYYTIRSDIFTDTKYFGGNNIYGRGRGGGMSLGIIAVVNKENGDGDFYFSSSQNLQFTITKPIQLNNVTTSIHKPDGSLAQVGDNCCIIYKIQKQRKFDPNILEEIIQKMGKKT